MDLRTASLILAGGESRRMGQDKALLNMPSQPQGPNAVPLLAHISHIARDCTPRTYVLTPWPERYADFLPSDLVILRETRQHAGPLVALHQGWSLIIEESRQRGTLPPEWLLVLACDLPALSAQLLQTWCQDLTSVSDTAIAALPRHQNRWEPLCGFYHQRSFPRLSNAINQGMRSFQTWLANEQIASLSVNDFNMLRNCNNPAQWQNFLDGEESRNPAIT